MEIGDKVRWYSFEHGWRYGVIVKTGTRFTNIRRMNRTHKVQNEKVHKMKGKQ